MSDDLVPTLELLCEIDPPEISQQWIDQQMLGNSVQKLISEGALVRCANATTLVCEVCEERHWIDVEFVKPGCLRGYCPTSGYHHVPGRSLERYAVNDNWIIEKIAAAFGLRGKAMDASSPLGHVGRAKFGPYACQMFFGRRLHGRSRFEAALQFIRARAASSPTILLTTTAIDLLPCAIPDRCAAIKLGNILSFASGKTSVDEDPIHWVLRGEIPQFGDGGIGFRFSAGFRSCVYGDKQFTFTDKQALAVEALYESWKNGLPGLHQTEIQGKADTSQRVVQLFSGNPAYGTLIQADRNGRYWLAL